MKNLNKLKIRADFLIDTVVFLLGSSGRSPACAANIVNCKQLTFF